MSALFAVMVIVVEHKIIALFYTDFIAANKLYTFYYLKIKKKKYTPFLPTYSLFFTIIMSHYDRLPHFVLLVYLVCKSVCEYMFSNNLLNSVL